MLFSGCISNTNINHVMIFIDEHVNKVFLHSQNNYPGNISTHLNELKQTSFMIELNIPIPAKAGISLLLKKVLSFQRKLEPLDP